MRCFRGRTPPRPSPVRGREERRRSYRSGKEREGAIGAIGAIDAIGVIDAIEN